jgi:hypothetical protein
LAADAAPAGGGGPLKRRGGGESVAVAVDSGWPGPARWGRGDRGVPCLRRTGEAHGGGEVGRKMVRSRRSRFLRRVAISV